VGIAVGLPVVPLGGTLRSAMGAGTLAHLKSGREDCDAARLRWIERGIPLSSSTAAPSRVMTGRAWFSIRLPSHTSSCCTHESSDSDCCTHEASDSDWYQMCVSRVSTPRRDQTHSKGIRHTMPCASSYARQSAHHEHMMQDGELAQSVQTGSTHKTCIHARTHK